MDWILTLFLAIVAIGFGIGVAVALACLVIFGVEWLIEELFG